MLASVNTLVIAGVDAPPIKVEVDIHNGLPNFEKAGFSWFIVSTLPDILLVVATGCHPWSMLDWCSYLQPLPPYQR